MDLKELFNYTMEGIKLISLGSGAYIGILLFLDTIPCFFYKKIKSQKDLEIITKEEAKKLKLTKVILPKLCEYSTGDCGNIGRGIYDLNVGGFDARRNIVKHELYHIFKGHCDRKTRNKLIDEIDYFIRREPLAILYGAFGIKL